ncbi:MAG: alanine--glyoxylate aminotransferase family protein [Clostridia bacterium]|nr:alanine--glyoxylate aminotransferase family protein [Clostridia bacterium]
MLNFSVGPVQSDESVLKIGGQQIPYFRTEEFSKIMLENENMILELLNAPSQAKAVFITGSGTASMEAVVMNTLRISDKALVVNGGSFGQRFVELLKLYNIPYDEISLGVGENLTKDKLSQYESKNYTAFLVNLHETSTGVLYDAQLISDFCKRNGLFLVVDAISAFLADNVDMLGLGANVIITGSQKALACAPGVSIIVLSKEAIKRVFEKNAKCMYLNLKSALKNQERGQTPFTPAVSVLLQIHERLRHIKSQGGVCGEVAKVKDLAQYFRENIKNLPLEMVTKSPSNAVTALYTKDISAYEVCNILKNEYGIWVCPNSGEMKDKIFRVGHIGALSYEDYDVLISALTKLFYN